MTMGEANANPEGPLSGLTVIEFGRFVTAPYAACLLGDMGATVIKLETPEGDPFRIFGKPGQPSPHFIALNRNKLSVALDLRDPDGLAKARHLVAHADVFIENSRPGGMARLGLDYETVRETNRGLVYCSITGAGEDGPYAQRPAYDMVGQALSGLASQFILPEDPKVTGPNLSDSLTGFTAAYGVLSALVHRASTGEGQRVSVNMIASSLAFLGAEAQIYHLTGEAPGPQTRPANSSSFALRCADGQLLGIHLSSVDKFWRGLVAALDLPRLLDDPRFVDRAARVANYHELNAILNDRMKTRPRDEWLESLVSHDVPCAPIHTMAGVFEDPQVRHLGLIQQAPDFEGNPSIMVRNPVTFSRTEANRPSVPPSLGEHTEEVLRRFGLES